MAGYVGIGLAVGLLNHFLTVRPVAALTRTSGSAQADAETVQRLSRQVYALSMLRMVVALAAAVIAWYFGGPRVASGIIGGLLVANLLSIWQNHRGKYRS